MCFHSTPEGSQHSSTNARVFRQTGSHVLAPLQGAVLVSLEPAVSSRPAGTQPPANSCHPYRGVVGWAILCTRRSRPASGFDADFHRPGVETAVGKIHLVVELHVAAKNVSVGAQEDSRISADQADLAAPRNGPEDANRRARDDRR